MSEEKEAMSDGRRAGADARFEWDVAEAKRNETTMRRIALGMCVAMVVGCGGSGSETPPPVEPIIPRADPGALDEGPPAGSAATPAERAPAPSEEPTVP